MKAAAIALVLALAASVAVAESKPPEPRVEAVALIKAFSDNRLAAEEKFQGKTIVVAGTIDKVGNSVGGQPYVVLAGQSPLSFVQCVFDPANATTLAQLKPGAPITIRGVLDGKVVGLMMSACSIVP